MAKTYTEFRKTYDETVYPVWASKALPDDVSAPTVEKIQQGWTIEKPRHNTFNWYQKTTDSRIQELEARVKWLTECLVENGVVVE